MDYSTLVFHISIASRSVLDLFGVTSIIIRRGRRVCRVSVRMRECVLRHGVVGGRRGAQGGAALEAGQGQGGGAPVP